MIKSIKKATDIINLVSCYNMSPVPLSVISKKIGINNSTCAHIVKTLADEGYLKKSGYGSYTLGINVLHLARNCDHITYLRNIIQPEFDKYTLKHGEEIVASIMKNGLRTIFCQSRLSDSKIDHTLSIAGSSINMPTWRILMAHADDFERNEYIKKNNGIPEFSESSSFSNLNEYFIALNKIKEKKLYILDNRIEIHHAGAPIIAHGRFICAIGSSMPKSRRGNDEAAAIFNDLLLTAEKISEQL